MTWTAIKTAFCTMLWISMLSPLLNVILPIIQITSASSLSTYQENLFQIIQLQELPITLQYTSSIGTTTNKTNAVYKKLTNFLNI